VLAAGVYKRIYGVPMEATTLRVVNGVERKVVASADAKLDEAKLIEAENELREHARNLVCEIEHKYWDLGRVLYEVYDGVPGGYRALMSGRGSMDERQSLFRKWGYSDFGDYCESEVGIRKRTGENLRYAYWWFSVQEEMPDTVIDKLVALGRSKVYLLSGFATRDSVPLWIEKAQDLTFEQLKKSIKAAKAVIAGRSLDDEEPVQAFSGSPADSIDITSLGTQAKAAVSAGQADHKSLPKPEEMHSFQTSFYDPQWDTVQSALDRAKKISKSEKMNHNLELICQDFLTNNDFSDSQEKDRGAYLAKAERRLGVMIIAVDPNTGKPIHGADLLWRLIQEAKAQ